MTASPHSFSDDSCDPPVRGYLHVPEKSNHDALILAHSAGSNAQAPLLIAIADAFSAAGFTVLRCDLPYRQSRPYGPPGPGDAARDRAGLKNAVASIKKIASGRIFLGGHSYGGRQSSMLCAELSEKVPDLVAGLLFLSYPLHPPRKPQQSRTQHLPNLRTPSLFIHGTHDPFGTIQEMEQALKLIPARINLLPIDGAGHDLGFKRKRKQLKLPPEVQAAFQEFFS
jgi:uncharacterized protein